MIRNFEISWPYKEDMPFKSKLLYGIDAPLRLYIRKIEN